MRRSEQKEIPALLELVNLGYVYLPRKDVARLREGRAQYILRSIAFEALRKINGPTISDKSIRDEIFKIESSLMNIKNIIHPKLFIEKDP